MSIYLEPCRIFGYIPPSSDSMVAHQLGQLAELYERSQTSELMSRTLDKLLTYEAEL